MRLVANTLLTLYIGLLLFLVFDFATIPNVFISLPPATTVPLMHFIIALITALKNEVIPALHDIVTPALSKCAEDAENEVGWVKFRDKYFWSALSSVTFWLLYKMLEKMENADK